MYSNRGENMKSMTLKLKTFEDNEVKTDKRRHTVLPYNKFVDANRTVVECEIDPSNTVSFFNEIDLTEIENIRRNTLGEKRIPYTAFIAKALAMSLKKFPNANRKIEKRFLSFIFGKRIIKFNHADIAVAVEKEVGEDAPFAWADILRDVDKQKLNEITNFLFNLRDSNEENNVQLKRYMSFIKYVPRVLWRLFIIIIKHSPSIWTRDRGACALISSPAKYGVDVLATTWSWPLGVSYGLVKDRPLVKDGEIKICKTTTLIINFDRRVMSGAQAAQFFSYFSELLRNPESVMRE